LDGTDSKMEFHLSTEVAWGLLPQVDGATDETEDLDEFCDHFGGHPKTAGRTFTGGAESFLKAEIGGRKPDHGPAVEELVGGRRRVCA
jgi:hypothetical protein